MMRSVSPSASAFAVSPVPGAGPDNRDARSRLLVEAGEYGLFIRHSPLLSFGGGAVVKVHLIALGELVFHVSMRIES